MKSNFLGFLFACILPLSALADDGTGPASSEIVWPTAGWKTSSPEEQGMSSSDLIQLIDQGEKADLDSVLVARNGALVLDAYYGPYRPGIKHILNSSTKGVIGTLIAIELQRGLLHSADDTVLPFFAGRTIANVDEGKKAISIQTLLDMTSGIDWTEPLAGVPLTLTQMSQSPDWVQFVLDRPMAGPPGTTFNYDSGNPQLLSAIIKKTTDSSALDFAKEQLFGPLGISDTLWQSDPQGNSIGGYGLYMEPEDMAKLGYLYLRNGQWEGKQLIPAAWVDRIKHASVVMNVSGGHYHYANLLWTLPEGNAFWFDGLNTEIILVLPDSDIVAVFTGRKYTDIQKLMESIIGAAKSDKPLPADPASLSGLGTRVKAAATEKPTPVRKPGANAKAISGKPIQLADNSLGLVSVVLNLEGKNPSYEFVRKPKAPGAPNLHVQGPIGLDGYYRFQNAPDGTISGFKGTWMNERTLLVSNRVLGDDSTTEFIFQIYPSSVNLEIKARRGFQLEIKGSVGDTTK
jgi:CubicO group peptidase (beta-lactamase class C family)